MNNNGDITTVETADEAVLLTDVQVSKLLGIPAPTLRRWRLNKVGPPYKKIGKLVRYDRAEVLEWIKSSPTFAGSRPHG